MITGPFGICISDNSTYVTASFPGNWYSVGRGGNQGDSDPWGKGTLWGLGPHDASIDDRLASMIPDGPVSAACDISSGFADAITLNLTAWYRDTFGRDHLVDEDSSAYLGGQVGGVLHSLAIGGATLARGSGYSVVFARYARTGGGGVTLKSQGKRVLV